MHDSDCPAEGKSSGLEDETCNDLVTDHMFEVSDNNTLKGTVLNIVVKIFL